jgi:predicted RNase H-like nuclease
LKEEGIRIKQEAIHFNLQGAALKAVEDQLDSLIYAYVAAHWWYWGLEGNWVLGDRATGYIIVSAKLRV